MSSGVRLAARLRSTWRRSISHSFPRLKDLSTVKITFLADGGKRRIPVEADIGDTLLDVVFKNEIDEVEGACEGTLACSTCHLIFEQKVFGLIKAKEEDEEDMLDLAIGVTKTSRLGCQVRVAEYMNGAKITIPEESAQP
ncbi:hypothetical protein AAMO2058_001449600 [Amorphochlora amoebiformis]